MTKHLKKALSAAVMLAVALTMMSGVARADDPRAPEIDPGSMAAALTLLSGGVFMLTGRRRKSS